MAPMTGHRRSRGHRQCRYRCRCQLRTSHPHSNRPRTWSFSLTNLQLNFKHVISSSSCPRPRPPPSTPPFSLRGAAPASFLPPGSLTGYPLTWPTRLAGEKRAAGFTAAAQLNPSPQPPRSGGGSRVSSRQISTLMGPPCYQRVGALASIFIGV